MKNEEGKMENEKAGTASFAESLFILRSAFFI
jgi:hypothetical protein